MPMWYQRATKYQCTTIRWNFVPQSSKSSKGSKYLFLFKGEWFLLNKRLPINVKSLLLVDSMEKSLKSFFYQKQPPAVFSQKRCSFPKFTGKHLCWSLFLNKVAGWGLHFIKKETPTQAFSCEFCEILKNTFFYIKHLRAIASVLWQNRYPISISFQ